MSKVGVVIGEALGRYGFPDKHPFGPERMDVYWQSMLTAGMDYSVEVVEPVATEVATLTRFHTPEYVARVRELSALGHGLLDQGDTPAFPGCFEAASVVVGSVLAAMGQIISGELVRAFVPVAGLHHAYRDHASGFCIFNDAGVAIEVLRSKYGVRRVAYVDIDAHHGDGVYYGFADDPEVFIADLHEDGRYLFPHTGAAEETGTGPAVGTKLNIPLPPGSDDEVFFQAWPAVETLLERARPELIILQAGADSLANDPLTHLAFSTDAHVHATRRLVELAERHCQGRLLALGGGGYNRQGLAEAWTAVTSELLLK
jgi:acetoin utilization protein AcuC